VDRVAPEAQLTLTIVLENKNMAELISLMTSKPRGQMVRAVAGRLPARA
jgi:hypothetical protein